RLLAPVIETELTPTASLQGWKTLPLAQRLRRCGGVNGYFETLLASYFRYRRSSAPPLLEGRQVGRLGPNANPGFSPLSPAHGPKVRACQSSRLRISAANSPGEQVVLRPPSRRVLQQKLLFVNR